MTAYIVTFKRKKLPGFPRKHFEAVDADDRQGAVQAARKLFLVSGRKPSPGTAVSAR